jgi:hypothetical protein
MAGVTVAIVAIVAMFLAFLSLGRPDSTHAEVAIPITFPAKMQDRLVPDMVDTLNAPMPDRNPKRK